MKSIYLIIALSPLFGCLVSGLLGKQIGRSGAHWVTILGVATSFLLTCYADWTVFQLKATGQEYVFNETIYTWLVSGGVSFEVGFLVDELTLVMMTVVTSVSLMVHVYTVGYMHDDPGYQRFFSYISLFTFAMLMLVMANNMMQMFFGWEGVGVVSYLLIGFWFKKESAIYANLKAFIVNRVGDFGLILGIGAVLMTFGTLNYEPIFDLAPTMSGDTLEIVEGRPFNTITVICILLFIGAMAKSAQVPLHVWLPDSMEGPTPISALIHAATMVTAGIFLVARMSPLFELSDVASSFVLIIGAVTALFMGFLGIVQNDIKRVVAYSTLSQLGYMTVALGVSAYAGAVFHLMTHAFFKALLFLAAGAVIIAMHHEQDIRRMGGLRKYLPITYITSLIGTLALVGFPGTAGFFSKDALIEAVHGSQIAGSSFAYFSVLAGVFVTALYSFRMFFLVFHGQERMDEHTKLHLKEVDAVVWVPLVLLAIPSLFIGAVAIEPMLFGSLFGDSIFVSTTNDVLAKLGERFHGIVPFVIHGVQALPFYLMLAGLIAAWLLYVKFTDVPAAISRRFSWLHKLLERKYFADEINDVVFAKGVRAAGKMLSTVGDRWIIDGLLVNGTAKSVGYLSTVVRKVQTGFLYDYAFAMVVGLLLLIFSFSIVLN